MGSQPVKPRTRRAEVSSKKQLFIVFFPIGLTKKFSRKWKNLRCSQFFEKPLRFYSALLKPPLNSSHSSQLLSPLLTLVTSSQLLSPLLASSSTFLTSSQFCSALVAFSCGNLLSPLPTFPQLFLAVLDSSHICSLFSTLLTSPLLILASSHLFSTLPTSVFSPLPASSQLSSRLFSSDFTFTHCQNKLMTRRFSFKLLSTQPQHPRTLLQPHCDLQTELQNIIEHHRTTMATRIASLPRRQSTKSTNLRHFFTRNLQCLNGKMINTTKSWQP